MLYNYFPDLTVKAFGCQYLFQEPNLNKPNKSQTHHYRPNKKSLLLAICDVRWHLYHEVCYLMFVGIRRIAFFQIIAEVIGDKRRRVAAADGDSHL